MKKIAMLISITVLSLACSKELSLIQPGDGSSKPSTAKDYLLNGFWYYSRYDILDSSGMVVYEEYPTPCQSASIYTFNDTAVDYNPLNPCSVSDAQTSSPWTFSADITQFTWWNTTSNIKQLNDTVFNIYTFATDTLTNKKYELHRIYRH